VTIRRGDDWGVHGVAPSGLVVAESDEELFALLNDGQRTIDDPFTVGLAGGDLWRTVGGAPGRARPEPGGPVLVLPVDLGVARVEDREFAFASHLVARRSWWRGEIVVVMNAQYLGRWDVATTSHPNDGRLDVVRVDRAMPVTERWKARRRLPTGTFMPHPMISKRRVTAERLEFVRPLDLVLDGVPAARHDLVELRVLRDALTVVI
jgi:hypothetical protein